MNYKNEAEKRAEGCEAAAQQFEQRARDQSERVATAPEGSEARQTMNRMVEVAQVEAAVYRALAASYRAVAKGFEPQTQAMIVHELEHLRAGTGRRVGA